MVKLYKDTTSLKYVVGQASNTDIIPCSEQPNEVRIYSESNPNGVLLTLNVDATLGPDEWEWDDTNKEVHLGEVKADTIVCFAGSTWLYNNVPVPVNSDSVEQVRVVNESTTLVAQNVTLSGYEIFDYSGSEPTILTFSIDGSTYSPSLNVGNLEPSTETMVYVKATAGSNPVTLRNVAIRLQYTLIFKE
jgi:hypothetical protein